MESFIPGMISKFTLSGLGFMLSGQISGVIVDSNIDSSDSY